ncbi:MAG: VCBS repeat-containing protein [Polyangiaceae bacterium]|nr:VCBS repeat-containing protein [Polyangiaceae bacterium]
MWSNHRLLSWLPLLCLLVPASAGAAPLFQEETWRLGSPQPCADSNEGCYSHYVLVADLDADGDVDILFANGGGYYVPHTTAPLTAYLNDGAGNFTEVGQTSFGGFEGRVRQIAAGDVDGDGDLDLYAPDSYGIQPDAFFINDGGSPPLFSDEGALRLPISSRSAGARFGDLDGDGDLDLVLTYWGMAPYLSPGTAKVYLNDGAGFFAEKPLAVPQDTQDIGTGPIDVDLFDADDDFDLDMVIASRDGDSLLFFNDGSGTFFDANGNLPEQQGPYVYGPDECDVDGDGDLDLWLDNGGPDLTEQLFLNNGSGFFRDKTATRVSGNVVGADDNEVQCVDIDGDGDFDAVVASLTDNERIYENDGHGRFTPIPGAFPAVLDSTLGLDFADWNGDGILDAVSAQGEMWGYLNRVYAGIPPQPADTRPPAFRRLERFHGKVDPGDLVIRVAISDAATTDIGPRLSEAVVEVTSPGGGSAPARFVGGDLFRAVIHVGPGQKVTYRACATDVAGNRACSEPAKLKTRHH